ncbi:hypothetical protein FACS1894137_04120 [Spirochaetia bacterium]|nr:hypothetical protein FACS1894137_04120 [Spirochaetia bacterium]
MKIRKIQRIPPIFLFCLLTLLFPACKSIDTADSGGLSSGPGARDFVSLPKERTVFLYPDTPDTGSKMHIALSLLDIARPENQFIMDVLYEGQSIEEYADKRLHGYDAMYGEMRNAAEKNPDMSREALNWFYNEVFAYNTGTAKAAVISRERDYYTGGAHGMRNKDYYVFSLEDKRKLTLGDIVRDESKQALNDLAEEELRKRMEIPAWIPLSEGGFFEDSVDRMEDFFLSPQGLGFQWDPYEIAPYSAGLIEIVLPYDLLQDLFTEIGISLTKEFR